VSSVISTVTDLTRFVPSPDNTQMWVVYHATPSPTDGWANRKARAQPLELRNGLPYCGQFPLPDGEYPAPSGSPLLPNPTPLPEVVLGPVPDFGKGKNLKDIWQKFKKGLSKLG